ncbi:MAG: Trp repressor-binding protein [Zetaproteobacteria bacterium]|nr:MAG: Trp repressor-binding protein [Zetaproteobacteria bacterium]
MQILILYHSDYGNTEKMARAIGCGCEAADPTARVTLCRVDEAAPGRLVDADVIFLGSPVHMGTMAWKVKKLIDECGKLWLENALAGKIAGIFATGGGLGNAGGGVELTLISLFANALEHGMIAVGFPKDLPGYADGGLHWGAYARCADAAGMPQPISEAALVAARSYGAHVTEVALRFRAGADATA